MADPHTESTSIVVSAIPPLVDGDRLTRVEFHRRYETMPHVKKAELIEGVVYISGRVPLRSLGVPRAKLLGWLGIYELETPGVAMAANPTVRLDDDNEPQPDGVLSIRWENGGTMRIDADDFIASSPDLIAEVAASTSRNNWSDKLRVYQRHGIREFLVWRAPENRIDWFVLHQGQYDPLKADANGILRSEVFPGLWLDSAALFRRDLPALMATLRKGCATPEHAAFVARLQAAGGAASSP